MINRYPGWFHADIWSNFARCLQTPLWLGFQEVTRRRRHITSSYERNMQWNFRNTHFIFNQSLNSGVVPADWRIANICALHKKNARELPENYRPISLTSISSKIFEHIVYSSISRFLSDNNILSPRQHGFRSGYSCETQLVLAVDDWARSIDRGCLLYTSDAADE